MPPADLADVLARAAPAYSWLMKVRYMSTR